MAEFLTEFLKLFEIRPEEAGSAFAELAGGGAGTATFAGLLEGLFDAGWKGFDFPYKGFPYGGFPIFPENLPPIDNWLTAAIPTTLALVGAGTENKDLFRVGLGGAIYGFGRLLCTTVIRNTRKVIKFSNVEHGPETKGKYAITGR